MQLGLLGPLEVRVGDREVPIAGARLRSLLCRLAVEPGRRVANTALVEAVWPDDPPSDAPNALQSLVSRLRRTLGGPATITQELTGYRLALDATGLDATVLAQRLTGARTRRAAGDLDGADDELTAGLALWRGDPLTDAGDADYADSYRTRWTDLHRVVLRERLDLALLRGAGPSLVSELTDLVASYPLDESLVALLMRALVATGRNAEALARFDQTRRYLAAELGTTPSRELQELHLQLLHADDTTRSAHRLAAGRAGRSNLRSWLTSFVGREADVDRVLSSVAAHRLTTVVGPGGAGKTRLATEVAARWLADNEKTAWLIELAPVTEESNIATAILGALGLRDARVLERGDRPPQDTMDRLVDLLRDSDSLLVIDNCEHLIESAANVIDQILASAPEVRVLTTSREPLAILGEAVVALPTLPVPPAGADLQRAAEAASVGLWLDRARAAQPDFVLDHTTLVPVIDIVRRLDGLPLAIELAAAKLRVLPLTEIARRLSDRFRLLTGGNRAALPRHRTLRAVVEWSWDLLSLPERLLAERLAVFPAGADLASAEAICADDRLPVGDVDGALMSLVDKSLLQSYEVFGASRSLRFRMLETIREYGVERLAERGELEDARLAHARYFRQLVLTLEPVVRGGEQLSALQTLDVERENVLAGLRFLGDSGRGPEALHLCLALVWYWSLLNSTSEAITWLRFVIEVNRGNDLPDLVFAEVGLALAEITADANSELPELVLADVAQSVAGVPNPISSETAEAPLTTDRTGNRVASVLILEALLQAPTAPFPGLVALLPMVAHFAGRSDIANQLIEQAMRSEDRWLRAAVQATTAFAAENDSDIDLMRATASAAYQEFRAMGDRWGMSSCLLVRGRLATLEGRTEDAVADYQEAGRQLADLGGSGDDETYIQIRLADLYARQGDFATAREQFEAVARGTGPRRSQDSAMFAEATLASLDWVSGDLEAAGERLARLRQSLLTASPTGSFQGHRTAIALSISGAVAAESGRLDQAAADLDAAYQAGLVTGDLPILAAVGVCVVALALALDQDEPAAVILGAAAQVRGADDAGDPAVARLTGQGESRLADWATWYDRGRSLPREEAIARLDPRLLSPEADPGPAARGQARLR